MLGGADAQLAGRGSQEPRNEIEQCRLATTAGPHHADELGLFDVEAGARHPHDTAGRSVVRERDVADLDVGHAALLNHP